MESSPRVGHVDSNKLDRTFPLGSTVLHQETSPPSLFEARLKESHELQENQPKVRNTRPDVTDTRGYHRPPTQVKEWDDSELSFGHSMSIASGIGSRINEKSCLITEDFGEHLGTENLAEQQNSQIRPMTPLSHHSSLCELPQMTSIESRLGDALGLSSEDPWFGIGRRLSSSLVDLPKDIQEHILKCQCSCDHLGYGNYSTDVTPKLLSKNTQYKKHNKPSGEKQETFIEGSILRNKQEEGGFCTSTRMWMCLVMVLAAVAGVGVGVPLALGVDPGAPIHQRLNTVKTVLRETPLFDGHNDLPWNIRKFMHNKLHSFNFTAELSKMRPWSKSSWSHTDLPRLREGMVGAQFWVSYVPCESKTLNAVQLTIEQIDLIKRLIEQYSNEMRLATSADEVEDSFRDGRIASLIGVEGGHAIQNSLGVLRSLRDLGVRYLTLTHTCSTDWAECARPTEDDPEDPDAPRGLSHYGKTIVKEMNRLGLLVDLSHTSQTTMRDALEVSKAPIMFSHSSVYAICKNPRNIPDDVLRKVKENGGIVMVSFYNRFLTCSDDATIEDVIEHINHVRKIAGVDHVGIGADFDGINMLPAGLEDVSGYPNLFAELLSDPKWTPEDLRKLAGHNLLRVMRKVEQVRVDLRQQKVPPYEEEPPTTKENGDSSCFYKFIQPSEESG